MITAQIDAIFAPALASIREIKRDAGYAADTARGHEHPASIKARRMRIEDAQADARLARNGMTLASDLLRRYARTEQDAIETLHALSTGLTSITTANTTDIIKRLDELADEIEFKDAA